MNYEDEIVRWSGYPAHLFILLLIESVVETSMRLRYAAGHCRQRLIPAIGRNGVTFI